jgi:hypothetical protein
MKCLQLTAKSWLLGSGTEDAGLLFDRDGVFVYLSLKKRLEFNSVDDVAKCFGGLTVEALKSTEDSIKAVSSFPVRHNDATVASEQPPLYKRANGVVYAAGYWVVKRDSGWTLVFCPKQDTIGSSDIEGPFHTRLEALNRLNSIKHSQHVQLRA